MSDELREQITQALVAGICTLWDDSQDAEEAWRVAKAAMNDGWPLIEAALEAKDQEIERRKEALHRAGSEVAVRWTKLQASELREAEAVRLLADLVEPGCYSLVRLIDGEVLCISCELAEGHHTGCDWIAAKNFLESKP